MTGWPAASTAIDSQPRFPGAVVPATTAGALNVTPRSRDRDEKSRVPAGDFAVHTTTTSGARAPVAGTSATRGGCSPPTSARAVTRTGRLNVTPPSLLIAA